MEEMPQNASKIVVPDELKSILKEYAKSIICAQPDDLLEWSANYFRTLIIKESELTSAEAQEIN